jgi:hypothetical protein
MGWDEFCNQIRQLPAGQLWRHNQAGDLPGVGDQLDGAALGQLVEANQGKKGFTYTHKPLTPGNVELLRQANQAGFTINVSANNLAEADQAAHTGLPVVTLLPTGSAKHGQTASGAKWVTCPAQLNDKVSCVTCRLCARQDRGCIVGFLPHGTGAKSVHQLASS